jgi:hypothetical protein
MILSKLCALPEFSRVAATLSMRRQLGGRMCSSCSGQRCANNVIVAQAARRQQRTSGCVHARVCVCVCAGRGGAEAAAAPPPRGGHRDSCSRSPKRRAVATVATVASHPGRWVVACIGLSTSDEAACFLCGSCVTPLHTMSSIYLSIYIITMCVCVCMHVISRVLLAQGDLQEVAVRLTAAESALAAGNQLAHLLDARCWCNSEHYDQEADEEYRRLWVSTANLG